MGYKAEVLYKPLRRKPRRYVTINEVQRAKRLLFIDSVWPEFIAKAGFVNLAREVCPLDVKRKGQFSSCSYPHNLLFDFVQKLTMKKSLPL